MNSLLLRLSLAFLAALLALGTLTAWRVQQSSQASILEFTQRLNAPIAMYMAQNGSLVTDGAIDPDALAELAPHVMMINPSVELYLLDASGHVIAQASEANRIAQPSVPLAPLQQFLQPAARYPLYGDNPLHPGQQRIFSTWPIEHEGRTLGYVYAVLAGERHRHAWSSLSGDYRSRDRLFILAGSLLVAGFAATLVFVLMTRRLRRLTAHVQARVQALGTPDDTDTIDNSDPVDNDANDGTAAGGRHDQRNKGPRGDEIDRLQQAYDQLAARLERQGDALATADAERRELLAMLSHDLRTPLTSLQGYLDTLASGPDVLTATQQQQVAVARRQVRRLGTLVSELFELSRLATPGLVLERERFSLLEVVHDCVQDHAPRADRRGITLGVTTHDAPARLVVNADIALMSRVLDNLLDNAVRHAPRGGRVALTLAHRTGMPGDDPRIELTVSNDTGPANPAGHAQLGVSIVRRILALHGGRFALYRDPDGCVIAQASLPA